MLMIQMNSAQKSFNDLENTVNEELKNVSDWLKANKLSLNIKKTKLIIFKLRIRKSVKKLILNSMTQL